MEQARDWLDDEFVSSFEIEADVNAGRIGALDAFDGQNHPLVSAGLIARARWIQGYADQTRDSFAKALEDPDCPSAVNIQFARFLCEQGAASGPNPPNPFPGWDEAAFRDEPEAFAYRAWLSGESMPSVVKVLPLSIKNHPGALIILAQPHCNRILFLIRFPERREPPIRLYPIPRIRKSKPPACCCAKRDGSPPPSRNGSQTADCSPS